MVWCWSSKGSHKHQYWSAVSRWWWCLCHSSWWSEATPLLYNGTGCTRGGGVVLFTINYRDSWSLVLPTLWRDYSIKHLISVIVILRYCFIYNIYFNLSYLHVFSFVKSRLMIKCWYHSVGEQQELNKQKYDYNPIKTIICTFIS